MALIRCHECGNVVSDNARACKKCGAPVIARIRREMKIRLIMSVAGIVVAVIAAFALWLILHNVLLKTLGPLHHQ